MAVAAVLAVGGAAVAGEPGLSVRDAWMRVTIPDRPAAGYFTLSNDSATQRTLTGASSPDCAPLMLHRSTDTGGQVRMAMVPKVPVPGHGTLRFAPGDYHLMCMDPTAAVRPGGTVPITLRFADGGTLETVFAVRGGPTR